MQSIHSRSHDEETINAYTHLVWALLSLTFMFMFLIQENLPIKYKTSTIMMTGLSAWTFISSFLYHSSKGRKKSQNREVDKASIFLMITGCGVSLNMSCADPVVSSISSSILILTGCLLTLLYTHFKNPTEAFSVTSYVLLGWFCVLPITGFLGDSLYTTTSSSWMIIAGGISYSIGILFYAKDSIKWNHTRWHICVMLGYAFHLAGHYAVMQSVLVA